MKSNRSLTKEQIEKFLTICSGLFLIAGFAVEHLTSFSLIVTVCYVLTYLSGGYFGVISSLESLKNREIDVDLLMVLAALGAAYVGAPFEGGMLLFLFALSNMLQTQALDRSRKAIQSLIKLRPNNVSVQIDGKFVQCKIEDVAPGSIVRVKPGESIALDGIVETGESSIDESSITGEPIPVSKTAGSQVFAGTVNQSGSIEYKVSKTADDSTLSKIIHLVEDAQSKRAKTQRFLETAERYYALGVILLTIALISLPPLLADRDFQESFYRAMTVMVVASPCALIISTPAAFLSAIGGAARKGILFKGGVHLERLAEVDTIAFDKTGTLTVGKPSVQCVKVLDESSCSEERLLQLSASVELLSEHPLAQAIENEAANRQLELLPATEFKSVPGKGAQAMVDGKGFAVGNMKYLETFGLSEFPEFSEDDPKTTKVWVASVDGPPEILGSILIADEVRAEARDAVKQLKKIGISNIVMLTGDQRSTADAVAEACGIDHEHTQSSLLPEQKVEYVRKLGKKGKVAMIGDGVNDAPALATAHVGIAMGAAGTDVAMETADVVLMSSNLKHVDHAIALARKSRNIVIQNLTFSIAVIVVLVTCALTIGIPLPLGVVGHEGSTVLVCLNGLRLLRFKP